MSDKHLLPNEILKPKPAINKQPLINVFNILDQYQDIPKHNLAQNTENLNLPDLSKDQSIPPEHIGKSIILYVKYFNNDPNLLEPDLTKSADLPTSAADKKVVDLPNNQYNCHEYIMHNINPKHTPSFIRSILSFSNISIGAFFPNKTTLEGFGYDEVKTKDLIVSLNKAIEQKQPLTQIENLELKPGDIVCCIDPAQTNNLYKEVHSAIVLGKDNNNHIILRQKLNEQDPVVDMTAEYFDKLELGHNKICKIYRKSIENTKVK